MNPWYRKSFAGFQYYSHPFFGFDAFYSPDRRGSFFTGVSDSGKSIPPVAQKETTCAFCLGRISEATPEKTRLLMQNNLLSYLSYPIEEELENTENVLFRRQANLFEIIPWEYWKEKYNMRPSEEEKDILEKYINDPIQKEYLKNILAIKLKRLHHENIDISVEQMKILVEPLFCGYHELLTSGRHFHLNAETSLGIFASGTMTVQEHRISYQELCCIMLDMKKRNNFLRYVMVFQNWLFSAGASFEHWHKQILAIDFLGKPLLQEMKMFETNPYIYKDFALGTAQELHLFIAENQYAAAYLEIGSKTGLIAICSKSSHLNPIDHTQEEINGMSDLVHAVYTVLGPNISCNEEWYYTPFNAEHFRTPWRVLINIRTGVLAGFENITQMAVNTIAQEELAEFLRIRMKHMLVSGQIAQDIHIISDNKLVELRYI